MIDARNDRRITSLFTGGSHHRNLSAFYRAESISSGEMYPQHEPKQSFFGAVQKPSRQIANLAKQMYPGQTDLFLNQYEAAAKRPFGYLLIDLKTTTQDNCRLRTNVGLSSGEGFNQACFQENIPQELVKYIKRKIFRLSRFFQLFKRYTATWMTCFLETLKIFGMMKKLSDTFSCKTGTLSKNN